MELTALAVCEPLGSINSTFTSDETSEVAWFDVHALPDLSRARVLPEQIRFLHNQWVNPGSAHFD